MFIVDSGARRPTGKLSFPEAGFGKYSILMIRIDDARRRMKMHLWQKLA